MSKVGIDVDGTITECPFVFRALAKGLLADGHEVHIITYRPESNREDTVRELAEAGVPYTTLHMAHAQDEMGGFKARIVEELGIEFMFDDSLRCLLALPKSVKKCWVGGANFENSAPMAHIAKYLGMRR